MEVEFLSKFNRDLDALTLKSVKDSVLEVIVTVEEAKNLSEIHSLKKLSGFKDAYRIRVGDYRIGIFVGGNTVQFARFAHRKNIYRIFP